MKYGLYDTRHKKWLGNGTPEDGPNSYDDEFLARAAALIVTQQFEVPFGTIRALPMPERTFRCVDQIESKYTGEEALEIIEKTTTARIIRKDQQ